jgi:hypothetical protein
MIGDLEEAFSQVELGGLEPPVLLVAGYGLGSSRAPGGGSLGRNPCYGSPMAWCRGTRLAILAQLLFLRIAEARAMLGLDDDYGLHSSRPAADAAASPSSP